MGWLLLIVGVLVLVGLSVGKRVFEDRAKTRLARRIKYQEADADEQAEEWPVPAWINLMVGGVTAFGVVLAMWSQLFFYAGFVAERVEVNPDRLRFYRDGKIVTEADDVETLKGTVSGPMGPRAIVTQHEFVSGVDIPFTLNVMNDKCGPTGKTPAEELEACWPKLFLCMEDNGLGSHRKLSGYGRVKLTKFERVDGKKVRKAA